MELLTQAFYTAVAVLCLFGAASLLLGLFRRKNQHLPSAFHLLCVGIVAGAFVLFLPLYTLDAPEEPVRNVLLSLHNVIRIFIVDADFSFAQEMLAEAGVGSAQASFASVYSILLSVLYVVAPLLTFGFVLSFFRRARSLRRYLFSFFKEKFVFSQLNDRSLTLAEDLAANHAGCAIIFTGLGEVAEQQRPLLSRAERLGAILFERAATDYAFSFHCSAAPIHFFAISDREEDTIKDTQALISRHKQRKKSHLYAFSAREEFDLLFEEISRPVCELDAVDEEGKAAKQKVFYPMRVRRVDEVRSLIQSELYENGKLIFDSAVGESGNKTIRALVLGLGQHGTEMLKALSWYCQMDGYRPYLHAFDLAPDADIRFAAQCPELVAPAYNGNFTSLEEAQYYIRVHAGVSVDSADFYRELAAMSDVTYIFVCLGNERKNLELSVRMRSYFASRGQRPVIRALMMEDAHADALRDAHNFKGEAYDIGFIGGFRSRYTEQAILKPALEKIACERHMAYAKQINREEMERAFWQHAYYYNSSVASAIHRRAKLECAIPDANLPPKERGEVARTRLRLLEHRRWNAYMRSIGYRYYPVRNDMAKQHNLLVRFYKLPPAEQAKDDD